MSEPNAVMFVRNYLIERDEALAPGEADDDERMESAREIVEGVRKSLSASIPAEIGELVERLHSMPTCSCAGDGTEDPNPYKQAAAALLSLSARVGELEMALEPFAVRAGLLDGKWRDHETHWSPAYGSTEVTIGDLRRARRVYEGGNGNV